ncbi:hypothetical protein SRHO_G00065360 [Serrasalmus rhombeus]
MFSSTYPFHILFEGNELDLTDGANTAVFDSRVRQQIHPSLLAGGSLEVVDGVEERAVHSSSPIPHEAMLKMCSGKECGFRGNGFGEGQSFISFSLKAYQAHPICISLGIHTNREGLYYALYGELPHTNITQVI